MLGVPFIGHLFRIERDLVADTVDHLNYYVTSRLLAFFSICTAGKQYFGSPIQCWTPKEFGGNWEKYAENYCFVANTYHVPMHEELPSDLDERSDQITYYRWVPIMLALQALFFYLPSYVWNTLHQETAINPTAFLTEAQAASRKHGKEMDDHLNGMAGFIAETVETFDRHKKLSKFSGYHATILYIFIKFLYVINCAFNMYLIMKFLGAEFHHWGFLNVYEMLANHNDETSLFPRVTYCDFEVRRLGQLQRYSVQCVIMMNMINEKIYTFLYFWFLFLFTASLINFVFICVSLLIPSFRRKAVLRATDYRATIADSRLQLFVDRCLHADGVLLLRFIREHAGGLFANELTNKLLARMDAEFDAPDCRTLSTTSRKDSDDNFHAPALVDNYSGHDTIRVGEKKVAGSPTSV